MPSSALFPYTTLFRSKPDGDHENHRRGSDHHAERGEGKAQLAGAKAVDGQLQNLAEHHGAACAQERLLECELAAVLCGVHGACGLGSYTKDARVSPEA